MIWGKVQYRFEGFHFWEQAGECSENHSYLRHLHRHMFHVTVWFEQNHAERDIEYFEFRDWLKNQCSNGKMVGKSCETIALGIKKACEEAWDSERKYKVEVLEDGENGALVE